MLIGITKDEEVRVELPSRARKGTDHMKIYDIYINDNTPPHETLIRDGIGEVNGRYLDITQWEEEKGLPVEGERYNIFFRKEAGVGPYEEFSQASCDRNDALIFILHD